MATDWVMTNRRVFAAGLAGAVAARAARAPRVAAEQPMYEFVPADNGAGPLWDYGSLGIARRGEAVFAAGLDTIAGEKPLNNCRWSLHRRASRQWERVVSDETSRQREPCPLGLYADGRLVLSVNPSLAASGVYSGPADPQLLLFAGSDLSKAPTVVRPAFSGSPRLTEHTYRGLGVDGPNNELMILHNDGSGKPRAHWAYLDRRGSWRAGGVIEYPIRGCYPQVALAGGAAHVMAVGDIVEPVAAWREWKFEQTKRKWDYVFRRLFYTWSPALASEPFRPVIEIANVDETAGHILNLDLWLAPDGAAHLLYLVHRVASRALRNRFFPDVALAVTLEHAMVRNGQVAARRTLVASEDEPGRETPVWARLHAVAKNRLVALVTTRAGAQCQMRVLEVWPEHGGAGGLRLAMEHPMTNFMTANERGGSRPGRQVDLMGIAPETPNTIRYALVEL